MEEDDVRNNLRTRIGAKRVVREPDCTHKLAARGEVAPHAFVFGVHRVAARDERDDAARTHLIEHLGGEVVVDAEAEAVVLRVKHLIISERHVADCNVKEPVGEFRVLKAGYLYVCVGVKLLRNAPGDTVQLYTVELTVSHAIWQEAKEIAHAAGRLEYAPTFKAQIGERIIYCANNCRRGVVRVERRAARCLMLLGREGGFEFLKFALPLRFTLIKGVGDSSPANVAGKRLLLGGSRRATLSLNTLERGDCVHIGTEFCFRPALAEMIVREVEVARRLG